MFQYSLQSGWNELNGLVGSPCSPGDSKDAGPDQGVDGTGRQDGRLHSEPSQ